MTTLLTEARARDYIEGYYAAFPGPKPVFEQVAFVTQDGVPMITAIVRHDEHPGQAVQWDVFEEDDGNGRVCLRGEF